MQCEWWGADPDGAYCLAPAVAKESSWGLALHTQRVAELCPAPAHPLYQLTTRKDRLERLGLEAKVEAKVEPPEASQAQKMEVRYYESHITIEPVFGERYAEFKTTSMFHGFKSTELLLQKRKEDKPERSSKDMFCTAHSKSFEDLERRMTTLTRCLRASGFKVWRQKIEAVMLDIRHPAMPAEASW